jgi:hypothetical protein
MHLCCSSAPSGGTVRSTSGIAKSRPLTSGTIAKMTLGSVGKELLVAHGWTSLGRGRTAKKQWLTSGTLGQQVTVGMLVAIAHPRWDRQVCPRGSKGSPTI